ncbi:MAG: hypothetical protein ACRDS9_23985 [Pseudonocardiaceae bacterium]
MSNNNQWPREHKLQLWQVLVAIAAVIVPVVVTVILARTDDAEGSSEDNPTPSTSTGSPSTSTTPTDPATPTGSESATPAESFSQIYGGKRLRITAPNDGGYKAVVDLDGPRVAKVLEAEWEDGSAASLGYDLAFDTYGTYGALHSSVPWKRNSEAAAPKSPEACRGAARTSDDQASLFPGYELGSGDFLCIETSDGKVAQAKLINFVEDPVSVTLDVTLWTP